jgi:FMN reductase
MSILFIQGSPVEPSRSAALLGFVAAETGRHGIEGSRLRLTDLPAHALLHARFSDPQIKVATDRVLDATAIVIATPVYKAAYSGLLKTFLDLLPQTAFDGKVVLPLATAGSPHHALALDYALRPVLQSMQPALVLPGVHATDATVTRSDSGEYALTDEIIERLTRSTERLIDEYNALLRRRTGQAGTFDSVPFDQVRCSI